MDESNSEILCRHCDFALDANRFKEVKKRYFKNAKGSDGTIEKNLNELWKELLCKPIDFEGLAHFYILVKEKKMSLEEVRQAILESDEYKRIHKPMNITKN